VSKFSRSGVSAIVELMRNGYMESDATVTDRLKTLPATTCAPAAKPPHIILVHDEGNFDLRAVDGAELGFRGDVGLTSRSAARQPQNVALPVRIQHLEAVIKAATKQGAFDWARQGVSARQEIAHGFRGCGRVANTQRSGGSSCHRIPAVRILLRECGLPDHSEFVLETGPDPRLDGRNLTGITITPPTV
jgi:hypothetical protein